MKLPDIGDQRSTSVTQVVYLHTLSFGEALLFAKYLVQMQILK